MEVMMIAGVLCLLTLSVIFDEKKGKIPNVLTATGLAAGLFYHLYRAGPPGLLLSLKSTFLIWLVTFLLYLIRALRGGDSKLLAALAAILGIQGGMTIVILSLFYGGVLGVLKILATRNLRTQILILRSAPKNYQFTTIHYSVAILLATIQYLEGWY